MFFHSTRSSTPLVGGAKCILDGLADDAGLYIPESIPQVSWRECASEGYAATAARLLCAYFTDLPADRIAQACQEAYGSGLFSDRNVFPLRDLGGFGLLELYTGPTAAFKDAAMCVLPYLMDAAAGAISSADEVLILTATSGDTGKAAMAGFAGRKPKVLVFYPHGGVSEAQLAQMLIHTQDNVRAVALVGNFDQAQSAVKAIFSDIAFGEKVKAMGYRLSSANSINIGRLIPQTAYYYSAYSQAVSLGAIQAGEKVSFVVPTGNFGDILAGYYAALGGLPVDRLVCASNENHILTDFFETGVYDANREFLKTISPSMDILISSNLERLLFDAFGQDPGLVASAMRDLSETGVFRLTASQTRNLSMFGAGYADEAAAMDAIREAWESKGVLLDPHTACAWKVCQGMKDELPAYPILLATASPYKFAPAVYRALTGKALASQEAFDSLCELTGVEPPEALCGLDKAEKRQETVRELDQAREAVLEFLEGSPN